VGAAVAETRHMKKRSEWLKKNPAPSGVQSTKRSETAAANSYWRLMSYKKRPTCTSVFPLCLVEDKSLKGGVMKKDRQLEEILTGKTSGTKRSIERKVVSGGWSTGGKVGR
jgi:hypothetical protein